MNNNILIYGELLNNNEFAPVVEELITVAQNLKQKIENSSISVIVLGCFCDKYDGLTKIISSLGADELVVINNKKLKNYSTKLYTHSILEYITQRKPKIFLLGATTQGRDIAPIISTKLETGLTADCTQLDINENGQLAATRPTFGGNLMATILCKKYPQMATVRPNVFQTKYTDQPSAPQIKDFNVDLNNVEDNIKLLSVTSLNTVSSIDLTNAKIIVAGGKGLKSKDGFGYIYKLAKLLNATPAATRGAVEAGFAPVEIQVGQTGKTVTPKIYLAFGISGAIQHTIGMNSSDTIIAINIDSSAPIANTSDYFIKGDALEILPQLIQKLENKK